MQTASPPLPHLTHQRKGKEESKRTCKVKIGLCITAKAKSYEYPFSAFMHIPRRSVFYLQDPYLILHQVKHHFLDTSHIHYHWDRCRLFLLPS